MNSQRWLFLVEGVMCLMIGALVVELAMPTALARSRPTARPGARSANRSVPAQADHRHGNRHGQLDPAEIPPGLVGLLSERTVNIGTGARRRRYLNQYACTGFVVSTARGQEIVTARHCLQPKTAMTIFDGQISAVALTSVSRTRGADVALVEPDGDARFPEIRIGRSESLEDGDPLCAWRLRSDESEMVWDRACSRFLGRRTVDVGQGPHTVLLMEHALAPGFSGGPVMDSEGRVVGIGVAITRAGYDIVEPVESVVELALAAN